MKLNIIRKHYPKTASWIELNIKKGKLNPKVWLAFVKYSELGASNASLALTIGNNPEIYAKPMSGAYGEFSGTSNKNRIFLSTSLCNKFEQSNGKNSSLNLLLQATVLHEMVHWGDWKDGKDQVGEEGANFERAAYGRVIYG